MSTRVRGVDSLSSTCIHSLLTAPSGPTHPAGLIFVQDRDARLRCVSEPVIPYIEMPEHYTNLDLGLAISIATHFQFIKMYVFYLFGDDGWTVDGS